MAARSRITLRDEMTGGLHLFLQRKIGHHRRLRKLRHRKVAIPEHLGILLAGLPMPRLPYTAPPPSLMTELREVAADAAALASEIAKANQLPLDFPAEQLKELLEDLRSLPDGTAEGCRQPLGYARSRLPAIRRSFIHTEEQARQHPISQDAPPPLTRGMTIDQRIGALVNSVTTALDEYRALAAVDFDDFEPTPSARINARSGDAVAATTSARNAEAALGSAIQQVSDITRTDSVTSDSLKRQMHDAQSLLRHARIEMRMPGFVPKWYRAFVDAVKDYPRILQGTAKAIRIGVDVARPLAHAWSHFEHGFKELVLDSIEHAASGLDAVGKKWETEKKSQANSQAEPDGHEDFDLEVAHKLILQGEAPRKSWQSSIRILDLSGKPISDVSPIARLTALQELFLDNTRVDDIAPLAELAALQGLTLNETRVVDFTHLARLTALERLDLSGTSIINLKPLTSLVSLNALYLRRTGISNLAPISQLAAMQSLFLDHTRVTNLEPIADLRELEVLDLNDTEVVDLGALSGLSSLRELSFSYTKVADITPLASLRKLQKLSMRRTRVRDLAPLSHLNHLEEIDVSETEVKDLSPLSAVTSLLSLDLSGLQVTDLKPLILLGKLQRLDLRRTPVTDLTPLRGLKYLSPIIVESKERARLLQESLDRKGDIVKAF